MTRDETPGADAPLSRELLATLAHEMRSPIGAILNWEELLDTGIAGRIDDEARAALGRVRGAALQLLHLVGGMSDLAQRGSNALVVPERCAPGALLQEAEAALRFESEPRATRVEIRGADPLPLLRTDPERASRALQLALGAAIKNTPGGHLVLTATAEADAVTLEIHGGRLDPAKDHPEPPGARPTQAGLRLAMARRTLEPINGSLALLPDRDGCTIRLRLGPLSD